MTTHIPPARLSPIRLAALALATVLLNHAALAADQRWSGTLACTDGWGNPLSVPSEAMASEGQIAVKIGSLSTRRPLDKSGGFTIGIALGRDERVGHLRGAITPQGLTLRPDGGEVTCNGTLQAQAAPEAATQAMAPAPAAPAAPAALPQAAPAKPAAPDPAMVALAAPTLPLTSSRIDDVLALLQRERDQAGKRLATTRALADAREPSGPAEERADFLSRRAFAAWSLERNQQAVADFRRAYEIARQGNALPVLDRTWYQYHLGLALFRTGDVVQALAQLRQSGSDLGAAIDGKSDDDDFRLLWHYVVWQGFLARAQVAAGDIAAAEEALAQAERGQAQIEREIQRAQPHEIAVSRAAILQARALRAELRGRGADADALHRQAIEALATYRDWPKNRWLPESRIQQIRLEALLARADGLARAGRPAEAHALARQVLSELGQGGDRAGGQIAETASTARVLIDAVMAEGRPADAARLAALALGALSAAGGARDSALRIELRLALARAHAADRNWPESLAAFEQLRTDLGGEAQRLARALRGDPTYALALLMANRGSEALASAETAQRLAASLYGDRHPAAAEAVAARAAVLAAAGRRDEAMAGFRAAMPALIDAATGPYAGESGARAVRLRVVVEAYLHELARGILAGPAGVLASGQQTVAAVDAMFRAAEAARSRTLIDAVASAALRSGLKDRQLAELVRRDQDAARRTVALYDSLAGWFALPANARKPADETALRRDIAAAEAERAEISRAIARRSPGIAGLARPLPVGLADLRSALRPGEALVSLLVGAERSYAIAVPQQGAPALVEAPLGRDALADTVARLRGAMSDGGRGLQAIPAFDLQAAYAGVYQPLLKPLEPALAGIQSLLVVADGALAQLPFALLPTEPVAQPAASPGAPRFAEYRDVPWLVRRQAVAHLPSATALVALRRMAPAQPAPRPFVGVGDPVFAEAAARSTAAPSTLRAILARNLDRNVSIRALESLPQLPDTRLELQQIAKDLGANPQTELYLGRHASEAELRRVPLDRYRVVAFATHGLAAGDVDGLLQPALALSSPKVTAEDGDGLLTMSEVLDLRLAADWVVLSACNTAGEAQPGAEVLSGLASAFFYSGARSLLVTHWAVETVAARLLTTGSFAAKTPSRAEALRQSMLALIDGRAGEGGIGLSRYSYAHPVFWAPFALVGDPG